MTNGQQWTTQRREEGFNGVYVWQDGPDVAFPDHQHPDVKVKIVTSDK
jgi:hypothetical protein